MEAIWGWFWQRGGRTCGLIGTAEPFSWTMRNGIWNFGVRWRDAWIFGLGKFLGLRTGTEHLFIDKWIWAS
jgi:hypothetical protein